MSKSIYINDMRRDIDEGGGGGGATSADQVSYNGGTVKGALDGVRGDLNTFQFRMNEGSGEYKLESEGADSWRPFKSGATMHLLWENPSPTVTFSEQTLSIDWEKYSYLVIKAIRAYNADAQIESNYSSTIFNNTGTFGIAVANSTDDFQTGLNRKVILNSDKKSITFGVGAYSKTDKQNYYCIPVAIYGMR